MATWAQLGQAGTGWGWWAGAPKGFSPHGERLCFPRHCVAGGGGCAVAAVPAPGALQHPEVVWNWDHIQFQWGLVRLNQERHLAEAGGGSSAPGAESWGREVCFLGTMLFMGKPKDVPESKSLLWESAALSWWPVGFACPVMEDLKWWQGVFFHTHTGPVLAALLCPSQLPWPQRAAVLLPELMTPSPRTPSPAC